MDYKENILLWEEGEEGEDPEKMGFPSALVVYMTPQRKYFLIPNLPTKEMNSTSKEKGLSTGIKKWGALITLKM